MILPFLSFSKPLIENDEMDAVVEVLKSGWITSGKKVSEFEQQFAQYKNIDGAVAVNSCTAALHLSLIAANIGIGDEVITTAFTFCATVNSIIYVQATPVLVDINPETKNIDVTKIKEKITSKTKALIIVHYAGVMCDIPAIQQLCKEHNLILIEDCAHAIESEYNGMKAGTIGDFGCFSFYVTKNITTAEGGMVIAKDKKALDLIKKISLHGMSHNAWDRFGTSGFKSYSIEHLGFKYNMTDIQAAIGCVQLKKIDQYWNIREKIWFEYNKAFQSLPAVQLPISNNSYSKNAYHLYTIIIDNNRSTLSRDEFIIKMTEAKIGVSVHYTSIAEHPYYQNKYQWTPKSYPNALKVSQSIVSLPLSASMNTNDVERVIEIVTKLLT